MAKKCEKKCEVSHELGFDIIQNEPVVLYKVIKLQNMTIANKPPNCYCFLKNNIPIRITRIFCKNNDIFIEYKMYTSYTPMFEKPISSKTIFSGIVRFEEVSCQIAHFSQIVSKAVKFGRYFIGFLHSEEH